MNSKTTLRTALIPLVLLAASLIVGCADEVAPTATQANDIATATAAPTVDDANAPAVPARSPDTTATAAPLVVAQAQTDTGGTERRFQLGRHYERLSPTQPTSSGPDTIEVAEIFWYGCPHCYTFDPYLESWKENLPTDVSFVRMPALWNEMLQIHARIFYTAEALNKLDEMHSAIFREIHDNRNGLGNPTAIRDLFANFGVDAATFDNTFESFDVYTKLQRADELARRYRVSSVPTIVVNGKYTTNATMAGSYPDLLEVIDQLVAMERAGE